MAQHAAHTIMLRLFAFISVLFSLVYNWLQIYKNISKYAIFSLVFFVPSVNLPSDQIRRFRSISLDQRYNPSDGALAGHIRRGLLDECGPKSPPSLNPVSNACLLCCRCLLTLWRIGLYLYNTLSFTPIPGIPYTLNCRPYSTAKVLIVFEICNENYNKIECICCLFDLQNIFTNFSRYIDAIHKSQNHKITNHKITKGFCDNHQKILYNLLIYYIYYNIYNILYLGS